MAFGCVTILATGSIVGATRIALACTSIPTPVVLCVAGVKKHGTQAPLPVLQQTFSNFFNREPDGFRRSLDIDNAFRGLGQHVLGGDHARARSVLDGFNLETLTTDDGTHEVVGDEKTDRGMGASRRGGRDGGGGG